MTPADAAVALAFLNIVGTALAVAGSIAGAIALVRFATTIKSARRFRAHMMEEHSQNTKSLKGTLRGCRKAIRTVIALKDREAYFRSLGALSITLQGAMSRYEAHISHDARHSVQLLSLLLLDATTVGHEESADMLKTASTHISIMLKGIRSPPMDPRPDG
ncbi:MAG: hypothetical protein EB824_02510 [Thaumarchaeota archaeon S15]|nr:hypothetical protein [Nitrososphaerota archaeon]RNJ73464.1 MAG: hypothetical protein EB833_02830 [Thaumarchaeota archaeon S13]RNJ74950.1 MAG: hypothetical protein EB824_02510 [Thaumarchaeota archaeon S15]